MFDVASKYCFSLDKKNPERNLRLFLLLYTLEKYVNGAIIEMKRLNRVRQAIKKELQSVLRAKALRRKNYRLTYLALDTHFYFICVDKVYKLLSGIAGELNDPDIKILAKKLKEIFKIRKIGKEEINVRHDLEHIDERCLGFLSKKDRDKQIRTHIFDFGNFVGDNFSFNKIQFPSDKKSLSQLKKIYTDLIKILTKKYASKDSYFVWRQQSEERYKKIMQKLKKAGLFRS